MPDTALRWTDQRRATADVRVEADDRPPAEVWQAIATADDVQDALVGAVRDLLADAGRARPLALHDAGVTALDGGYARFVAGLDRAPETDAHEQALDLTAQLGQDGMTVLGHAPINAVATGPVALLDAADRSPTVAVRVSEAFRERPRRQREATLSLLTTLATTCDVWLVTSRLTACWLLDAHRDGLPSSFSESVDAHRPADTTVDEVVATARSELDADGRPVRVLRDLAAESAETLSYAELRAQHDVSAGRVSQVLDDLEALGLAERYGPRTEQRVELLPAGSAFLDALDADLGRQAELDREFSRIGQSPPQSAVYSRAHEGPPKEDAEPQPPTADSTAPYRTRFLNRRNHAPAAAAAADGGVTALEAPIPDISDAEDRHTRFASYDPARDEAVLAVHATGPLQYMTSIATALASPRFFDAALPVDRLEEIDISPSILRNARCIGGLSSEAEDDGQALRNRLVEWGEALASMTTALANGQYEDRDRFRGEILRSAQGLAGTIVHLLDVAGVDIVRELRVPRGLSDADLAELATTVSVAAAIQSKYGAFTVYRQVFEDREGKRQMALSPEVDAADPLGEYIGGLVLRGPDAERLGQHVEGMLASPKPVHEDAPEIAVHIPVTTPDRSTFAEAATRMCQTKSLSPTREAVTLFRAVTDDPYAVAEALHWLGSEDRQRDLRLDEVRVALSHLDADQLLPDAPPTVSKAIAVLLGTATPLTQSELAEKADVSARSLRRYLDILEALDLIRNIEGGYRIAFPDSDGERGERIFPEAVGDDLAAPQDILLDIALTLAEEPARLSDPEDPVGAAFCWPPDLEALRRGLPRIDPWVRVARVLAGEPDPPPSTVEIGPDVDAPQTSLQTATDAVARPLQTSGPSTYRVSVCRFE
jgi:hypothetical protein